MASSEGSNQATPRSLWPGTVPRLNLSPAVAMHAAALEHPSDDEEELLAPRDAAPPVAVPSFDDLSGPEDFEADDSEAELERSHDSESELDGDEDAQQDVEWRQAGRLLLLQSFVSKTQ